MVDIGGGITSVSILSIDGIVVSHTIDLGGDDFDEAIVRYVKNHYGLMIGEQAADRGNQQYIFHFDGHRTMLVQDNTLPTIAINIEYFRLEEMGE